MIRFRTSDADGSRAVWGAEDAIVIKAISLVLTESLIPRLSRQCTHLSGHGGIQAAISNSRKFIQNNTFFFKTDIASFYSSIHHDKLCAMLKDLIEDEALLKLIYQTIRRTEIVNGYVNRIQLGIPLSPLLAGVFLLPIDNLMSNTHTDYIRFMDDYVFFTNSRRKLKDIIRKMYIILNKLKLAIHSGKTKVGKLISGFDFLGFSFIKYKKVEPSLASYISYITKFKTKELINKGHQYIIHFRAWLKGCRIDKSILSRLFKIHIAWYNNPIFQLLIGE